MIAAFEELTDTTAIATFLAVVGLNIFICMQLWTFWEMAKRIKKIAKKLGIDE